MPEKPPLQYRKFLFLGHDFAQCRAELRSARASAAIPCQLGCISAALNCPLI